MNEVLSELDEQRGISVVAVGINTIAALPEDEERIKQLQLTAVMRDPNMRDANLSMAQGEAMKTAAGNEAGAMMGFMGMNMAQQPRAACNAGRLRYDASPISRRTPTAPSSRARRPARRRGWTCPNAAPRTPASSAWSAARPSRRPRAHGPAPTAAAENTGKFCMECGTPKPCRLTAGPAPVRHHQQRQVLRQLRQAQALACYRSNELTKS